MLSEEPRLVARAAMLDSGLLGGRMRLCRIGRDIVFNAHLIL
jgi:hypothetical protein